MAQLVTRIDDEVVQAIDALIADGQFASRSDVVREGLARLLDGQRRADVGERIVAGYERIPETDAELDLAVAVGPAMIDDEPW